MRAAELQYACGRVAGVAGRGVALWGAYLRIHSCRASQLHSGAGSGGAPGCSAACCSCCCSTMSGSGGGQMLEAATLQHANCVVASSADCGGGEGEKRMSRVRYGMVQYTTVRGINQLGGLAGEGA